MGRHIGTRCAAFALAALIAGIPLAGHAADPFEINAILAVTGSASFLGKAQATALTVLEDQVNKSGGIKGRPIKFVIADDQSNPQVGLQLMNGIIAKKTSVVIGSSIVAICSAMVPLATDGPAVFCLSPALHPPDGSYAFSAGPSTTDSLLATASYFRQRGWHKIAVITSNDATGQDADRGIESSFTAANAFQLVDHEHFNTTDVSVAAQMAHIKSSGAQAIIAWSTGTPMGTLLRGMVDAGIDLPVVTSSGNLTYAQMKAYANFLPKEFYFTGSAAFALDELPNGPGKTKVGEFMSAFKSTGSRPDEGQVVAWDPALLIIDAYKSLGFNATAAQIRDYINGQRNWPGITGSYDFRAVPQRGLSPKNVVMVRWDTPKDTWVAVSKPGGDPLK